MVLLTGIMNLNPNLILVNKPDQYLHAYDRQLDMTVAPERENSR